MNSPERTDPDENSTPSITKRFEGYDARFGTNPREIYIELRAGSPAYIRLREGEYLQEGDAFRREQLGMGTITLDTWEVTAITPNAVVGRTTETSEEITIDRTDVETGLAVGRCSTNLTDFEQIGVYQVNDQPGSARTDGPSEADDTPSRYVSVVAYGDNGLRYGRRYRFVDTDSAGLVLWRQDQPRSGFSDEVAQRLDERTRAALESEGYVIYEANFW